MQSEGVFRQVLISVGEKDLRVAVLEDGQLVELFLEREGAESLVGNIYKGRVEGVVPGLQAAFVNIGAEKNAFMHFSDVMPESLELVRQTDADDEAEAEGDADANADGQAGEDDAAVAAGGVAAHEARKGGGRKGRSGGGKAGRGSGRSGPRRREARGESLRGRPVERLLKPGQDILVQVTKDPINTKGPRVTSALSLPGRYLVLLPFPNQSGGVSKKVEDPQERRRLRKILGEIEKGGHAHIVRTVGVGRSADEIKQDVGFLEKQWRELMKLNAKVHAPALLHDDQDILYRLARDQFNDGIDEIWLDSASHRTALLKHLKAMIPELMGRVHLHTNRLEPLFDYFDVERQIRRAMRRKVWLKSGGYLIFDEMEAMTAIDVNSGKYTGRGDQQKTILKTNTEAAHMVARQLRLRDIGGLIVIDFIDMEREENRRSVFGELKALLRHDRARVSLTSISEFGLVEMTRQRVRKSLRKQLFQECPHCQGEGMILSEYEVWRALKREVLAQLVDTPRPNLEVRCHPGLLEFIENETFESLAKLERLYRIKITLTPEAAMRPEEFEVRAVQKAWARKRAKRTEERDEAEARPGKERWKERRELARRDQAPAGRGGQTEDQQEQEEEWKAEAVGELEAPPDAEEQGAARADEQAEPDETDDSSLELDLESLLDDSSALTPAGPAAAGGQTAAEPQRPKSRRRRGGRRHRSKRRSAAPATPGQTDQGPPTADAMMGGQGLAPADAAAATPEPAEPAGAPAAASETQLALAEETPVSTAASQETGAAETPPTPRASRRRRGRRSRGKGRSTNGGAAGGRQGPPSADGAPDGHAAALEARAMDLVEAIRRDVGGETMPESEPPAPQTDGALAPGDAPASQGKPSGGLPQSRRSRSRRGRRRPRRKPSGAAPQTPAGPPPAKP